MLSTFVTFAVVSGTLALALPEAVVGPRRLVRVIHAWLPVAASVGGFLVAPRYWEASWLALIIGGIIGSSIGSGVQQALFPGLTRERIERWRRQTPPQD